MATSRAGSVRSGRGIGPPGLTKTEALRQAKSAAFVKGCKEREREQQQQQQQAAATPACCRPRKPPVPKLSKVQQPPAESAAGKKVSIGRPGMTKAMLARVKHAQKFRQELEEKKMREELPLIKRRAARRPAQAPTVAGRERGAPARTSTRPRGLCPSVNEDLEQEEEEEDGGDVVEQYPPRAHSSTKPSARRRAGAPIPRKTCELARSINADVVQAEPVGGGPVDSIVIPPGTVNECRTTIISIPRQAGVNQDTIRAAAAAAAAAVAGVGDRSIRVLNDSLNEQDVVESAAVQGRLMELQQARREFVMAVANVGGNAISLAEQAVGSSPGKRRFVYKVPDITDECLQIKYGRDHPDVMAAREFAARSLAGCRQRESQQRMEREFRRLAREPLQDQDLRLDVPLEQELMEGDISFEEDEETGMVMPCPSRIKASMPRIPTRVNSYVHEPFDVDELERFFDVRDYPPCFETAAVVEGPPPGRENLNPDLWYIDDPWCYPPPDDGTDLIDFDDY